MMDSTPQSRASPSSYTQITPSYTPSYLSIQMTSNFNLFPNNPQLPQNSIDDDKPLVPEYPRKDENPSTARQEAKRSLFLKGKSLRKFLAFSILFLMIANLAIIISLAVSYFNKKDTDLPSVAGALSYIAFNLGAHPILNIQVQDDDGSPCPQDYERIVLGTWPGTTPGCDCGGSLTSGFCDRSKRFCNVVVPIEPIDIYNWGDSKWCVKRAKLGSQYQRAADCSPDFRKCSSGICVLETLNCPLTKFSTGIFVGGTGPQLYLITWNTEGESPLIDLTITPNDVPCFSADKFASGPVDPYVLIDENEKGCGKYGLDDQLSFQVDSIKQRTLFDQNDFPFKVYALPDYGSVYDSTFSVFSYRKRLSLAEGDFCSNINTEVLEKSSKAAKDLDKFMHGTLIAAIILHSILFLAVGISACVVRIKSICSEFFNSKIWIYPYLVLGLIELIDFIVMFAATTYYRGKIMGVTGKDCFLDPQAQSAMSDYEVIVDGMADTFFKGSLGLFLTGTFVVFTCVYLLFRNRG